MKKQKNLNWPTGVLAAIAAVACIFAADSTASAQRENSKVGERYGAREPRTCDDTKAPAKGAITADLAAKYLNCQKEGIRSGNLYLVENLKVEAVGGGLPYAAIMGHRSLPAVDVNHPVYPIRGSFLEYSCRDPVSEYVGPPNTHCTTYNHSKAEGYCYKTTFGDWQCQMGDKSSMEKQNVRAGVAPPKP